MVICPFCIHETTEGVCTFCFKEIHDCDFNEVSPLMYTLNLALVGKEYAKIIEICEKILSIKSNNLVSFYMQFALYKLNNEPFDINNYQLTEDEKIKALFYLQRNGYEVTDKLPESKEINLADKLFPLVNLRLSDSKTKNNIGLKFLIFGVILFVITFLISLWINKEVRIFSTILLMIIPSLVMTGGIIKLHKYLPFFRELIFIAVLIIISYLSLIYLETNFITHIKNVIFAPYEFLKYLIGKVIINL